MSLPRLTLVWTIGVALSTSLANGGPARYRSRPLAALQGNRISLDREVAGLFAPIFYQALGDKPRSDYITNFDFDGDWRGDNNWIHAEDKKFSLKAYVYYSVAETATHFFIHYAVFHPRDYKGGERRGAILSELIREGAKRGGKYDPTGLASEATLAHENDLEGCLVVVEKNGKDPQKARAVYVETLHHNNFSRYITGESSIEGATTVTVEGRRPLLYIEPKGHGIEALDGEGRMIAKKRVLIYKFFGRAEDPAKAVSDVVGYELAPIQTTLWARAQTSKKTSAGAANPTFGVAETYNALAIELVQPDGSVLERKFDLGTLGSAFLGKV
ncbi:MAG: hypothetical protein ACRD8U_22765, partial [Pyrinomonadaceae bacterium]